MCVSRCVNGSQSIISQVGSLERRSLPAFAISELHHEIKGSGFFFNSAARWQTGMQSAATGSEWGEPPPRCASSPSMKQGGEKGICFKKTKGRWTGTQKKEMAEG